MPNKDLTFRLFGEDKSASSSVEGMSKRVMASADKIHKGFGKLAGIAGGIGLAAGAATAGIIATAVTGAQEAEKSQAKIAGSLGLTATESARLGTLAGKVYANNYGDSLEAVQDTIANVVSGISGMRNSSNKDVESMTSNVLSFASAFDMDASEAVQQVNQLMSSKLAKDGPQALDLLTAAMQRVPKAVRGDLMDAVNEYSPFMHQLGLSGAQSMQLLVDSTGKGMFGLDKTGDALKEFTIRSTDMSKTSVSAYKSLGLNAHDMAGRILHGGKSAAGGFDQIIDRLLAMKDPVKRSNTAIALFGTQMEDLGVGEVPKFLSGLKGVGKGMESTAGSASKLSATTGGGASNAAAMFSRKWEMVTQSLVTGVLPVITKVFTFLAEHEDVMKLLAIGVGVAAVAFTAVSVAMWAAAAAEVVALGPILLIVAGVALLVAGIVLLVTHWKQVCSFLQSVWAGVCKWFADTLTSIGQWWSDTWDGMIRNLTRFLAGIGRFFGSLPGKILGWLAGAGTWLLEAGSDLLSGLLEGAKKGLIAVGRWELGIATKVIGWLAGAGTWLLATGSDLLAGLLSGAKTGLTAVATFMTGFPGRFLKWTANAGKWLLEAGGHIVDGLVQGLRNKIGAVGKVVSDIAGTVAGVFTKKTEINSPSKLFERFGKWIGEGLIKGLAGTQDDVRSAMGDLADKVSEGFTAMTEKRKQLLESTKELWKKEKQLLEDEPKVHKDKNGKISAAAKESYDDAMKAWRRRLAAIRSQEREEKAEYSKLGSTASQKALQSNLTKLIAKDTAALEVLAARRDVLTDRLKDAQDELQKASDAYKQTYTSTFDSTFATGNVVSSYQAVAQEHAAAIDSIKSLREQLADLDSTSTTYATDKSGIQAKIADQQAIADGTGNSASRMRSTLTQQVEKTRRFQADLKQLVGMGIDPATYQQLLTAGISGGGLEAADDLLADGPGGVQQMAALQAQLKAASDSLATDAADQLNGVGVQVAQGLVDGITSQLGAVTDAMDKISAALVKTLKQKLDIHSPSRVMAGHGKQIPAGLVVGINSGRGDVESSMSALVNTRNRWATAPGSTGQPGQIPTATGERALVHIENFHATPEQSPAEIAADLGWLTRGGL